MARYIDADELYVNIKAECNPYGKPTINFDDGCKVLDMIRRTPTADVAPVRHARWIVNKTLEDYRILLMCPCCTAVFGIDKTKKIMYGYCPNCGAKMDEEVEDAKIYKHR